MKRVARLLLALAVLLAAPAAGAQDDKYQTIINGTPLTAKQKADFRRMYGVQPLAGDFWYDARSGLWGVKGREAFGILRPGHDFGPLSPMASAGNLYAAARAAQARSGGAHYYRDGMGTSVAVSSGCATGSTGTGSSRVDFIVGCN